MAMSDGAERDKDTGLLLKPAPKVFDMLEDIFDMQLRLQRVQAKAGKRFVGTKDDLRSQLLAAFVELGAAAQELDWKPWKMTGATHRAKFLEEVVDLQHFTVNLLQLQGVTPGEFYAAYAKKHRTNVERVEGGY